MGSKICKNVTVKVCKEKKAVVACKKAVVACKKAVAPKKAVAVKKVFAVKKTVVVKKKVVVVKKKVVVAPKKTIVAPKKTIVAPKKTIVAPKKTVSGSKKISNKTQIINKVSTNASTVNKSSSKKSEIKNKLLAAVAAAGLFGIGYLKVIAPILEKSRIAKEEASMAISLAKTEEERRVAEQEYAKRDSILQIQESVKNELGNQTPVVEQQPIQTGVQPMETEALSVVPQDNRQQNIEKLREDRQRREEYEADRRNFKREEYKQNVSDAIERIRQRTEAIQYQQERRRAAIQEAGLKAQEVKREAIQRLQEARQVFGRRAEEAKQLNAQKAEEAKKRAEEAKQLNAQRAEEAKQLNAQKAEEAKKRAEEAKQLNAQRMAAFSKKTTEIGQTLAQKAFEFRRSLNNKVGEIGQRLSKNSQPLRSISLPPYTVTPSGKPGESPVQSQDQPVQEIPAPVQKAIETVQTATELNRRASEIGQSLSQRAAEFKRSLSSGSGENSQQLSTRATVYQSLPNLSSGITTAVSDIPDVPSVPREQLKVLDQDIVSSPVSMITPSRASRRQTKKNEALNSGPCTTVEEQDLRAKSRMLSFQSSNFRKQIEQCGAPGITGVSINGEYFDCIPGESGAQEMKEEYLDAINNLIIKAKVCSDKRVKNENTLYFENIRNATARTKTR